MTEQTARAELTCLGRAPLAASIVLMSALLAEIILALAVDVPPRAWLALVTGRPAIGVSSGGRKISTEPRSRIDRFSSTAHRSSPRESTSTCRRTRFNWTLGS